MRTLAFAFVLLLAGCAGDPPPPTVPVVDLDAVAPEYGRLILGIGEHEEGYVDAYYGPPEWQAQVKANKPTIAQLKTEADRLLALVRSGAAPADPLLVKRRDFLEAHLRAARFRLDMIEGARPSFQDEAEALFAIRPQLEPLTSFDPVLARIEAIVPDGPEPLSRRVEAFRTRYTIPKDRLNPVMRAAIAECRRRTLEHIRLPADEAFTLEFVTGKSWSGYNYYQGGHKSLIQINTDLPIFIDRAVDLGCHEGYPGHHTQNVLLETRLVEQRGWREYAVYPLFSPLSFIAEGTSNYGIELAFPGPERTAFEAEALFPLAGLDPSTAAAYAELRTALAELGAARFAIAADYLDKRITREQAVELTQRYLLVSPERAEQLTKFTEQYRSYVINYGLGQDVARAHVERAAAGLSSTAPMRDAQAVRWRRMEQVLSEPTLPRNLLP